MDVRSAPGLALHPAGATDCFRTLASEPQAEAALVGVEPPPVVLDDQAEASGVL